MSEPVISIDTSLIRDGKLVELTDQPYDSENLLQTLLAEVPSRMWLESRVA